MRAVDQAGEDLLAALLTPWQITTGVTARWVALVLHGPWWRG